MDSPQVVVVGSYNLDVAIQVARFPAPGETCLGLGRIEVPGGKGANQAVQAARAGARVAMLAALGPDGAGDDAVALFRREGIDSSAVMRLSDAATGIAVILVEPSGENCIVVESGANARVSVAQVEAAMGLIQAAKIVVAQLETPISATRRAFEIARDAGIRTLLNAAPAAPAPDLLPLTDILVVNEREAETLAGIVGSSAAATALLGWAAEAVIVTLGGDGALLLARGAAPLARQAHRVEVVDTTGAGDAFVGALAARLAAGETLPQAMDFAIAAGSLACTVRGATPSFARAEAIVTTLRA